jgi:hypothetical protein
MDERVRDGEVSGDYLIFGQPGTGKSPVVQALAANTLAQRRSVVILDIGGSYASFCRAMGGTYVRMGKDGWSTSETFGKTPLYVCDFDSGPGEHRGALPFPIDRAITVTGGLLVVDEVWHVERLYPELQELIRMQTAAGGSFCVVGQREEDVAPFGSLSPRTRLLKLSLALKEA